MTNNEAMALASELATMQIPKTLTAAVFPNTMDFIGVRDALAETSFAVGSQNVAWVPQGAYTGATSAHLFHEAGAAYALVGHSERRHVFGETDEDARKKVEACMDVGIVPVLCIGETKEDLDAGKREYRLKKQLRAALEGLDIPVNSLMIAYEPVWAISAGGASDSCDPDVAQEVHMWLKQELRAYSPAPFSVLYGGSVTPENVVSFTACPAIDGVLVGSASTHTNQMRALLTACA